MLLLLCFYSDYDPVVPMELAQYSSDDSQEIVVPPIKCMKWHYDTIQEVHKRRYLLRVRRKDGVCYDTWY